MQIVQRKKKTYYQRTHSEQGGAIKVQVGVDSHDLTRILHQSGREIKKLQLSNQQLRRMRPVLGIFEFLCPFFFLFARSIRWS